MVIAAVVAFSSRLLTLKYLSSFFHLSVEDHFFLAAYLSVIPFIFRSIGHYFVIFFM